MCARAKKIACLTAVVLFGPFVSATSLDHPESYLESPGADSNDANYERRGLVGSKNHRNLMMTPDGRWTFNPVVYGLLHIMESGSAEINGQLSMNSERVCGAKGYSYDAYNANQRFIKQVRPSLRKGKTVATGDIYSKIDPSYSRNNVPFKYMEEIGFEDCDYVVFDAAAIEWGRSFSKWFKPLELHVPCRDPIDLLMSMCHHQGTEFSCKENFDEEVNKCLTGGSKFVTSELTIGNINLKCFGAPSGKTAYLDYMKPRLQVKALLGTYARRDFEPPRSKEDECVWKNDDYRMRLQDHLKDESDFKDYFEFCDKCMVSGNNLLL